MLELFKIFVLSLVESVTEFIPVSSTTHLLIVDKFFLKSHLTENSFFLIFIQLGSLLALFFYYKDDIKRIFVETYKLKKEGYVPFFCLLNSFIVSGVLSLFIKKTVQNFSLEYTAYSLIGLGFIMILLQRKQDKGVISSLIEITPLRAFFIGIAQAFAVLPGVSRLGITMVSGILLNFTKENAIKFSFLLGIPTMLCGSLYEFIKLFSSDQELMLKESLVGFFMTFVLSFFLIKLMIRFLIKTNIKYFGHYRVIFGLILLLVFYKAF
jgi:undecaprenyl-diphosphatase